MTENKPSTHTHARVRTHGPLLRAELYNERSVGGPGGPSHTIKTVRPFVRMLRFPNTNNARTHTHTLTGTHTLARASIKRESLRANEA